MNIRTSTAEDVQGIADIYNHYIQQSHATFDLEPKSLADRQQWFAQFNTPSHLCFSAVSPSQQLLGYACSSEFKAKRAYASSVEVSVYVAPDAIGQGVGKRLYQRLLPAIDSANVHRAYAGIALPNPGSLALHQAFGFTEVGHLSEVGFKFERYWDVVWLQRCTLSS